MATGYYWATLESYENHLDMIFPSLWKAASSHVTRWNFNNDWNLQPKPRYAQWGWNKWRSASSARRFLIWRKLAQDSLLFLVLSWWACVFPTWMPVPSVRDCLSYIITKLGSHMASREATCEPVFCHPDGIPLGSIWHGSLGLCPRAGSIGMRLYLCYINIYVQGSPIPSLF